MLTSDPKRIEEAHTLLQRLEDEVVGDMTDATPAQYRKRLERIHATVWAIIKQINEAYDNA